MTLATGVFATPENPSELNARSFAPTMLRLFPDGSFPLTGLSASFGRTVAKQAQHGYFSKTMTFINTTTTGANSSTETIPVASSVGMLPGMVLHNPRTRENIRIKSVDSASQITAQRGFGRIAGAVMNNADTLIHIGTAFAEGSTRPVARRLKTVYVPNYTQIFRNAWALTDTARASLSELGYSNIAESRKDCSLFHLVDIESAVIWGQPYMDTSGDTPVHATQGVLDAIEQYAPGNSNSALSTTNYDQLEDLFTPAFEYSTDMSNPRSRLAIVDDQASKVINTIARKSGYVQLSQQQTSFGMSFTSFKFRKGEIAIKEHPLLNGLGRQGLCIIIDMPALKLAYLNGRDTKAEEYGTGGKIVEHGVDGVGGSLTSELAVELINPYACAVIDNLTAGVPDVILTEAVSP